MKQASPAHKAARALYMRMIALALLTTLIPTVTNADGQTPNLTNTCVHGPDKMGPARLVQVETKGGGSYGTLQYPKTVDINSKELVFTFDDGPDPKGTLSILNTLDEHCLKATFFFTGLRADRYPELVQEAARRGHTIAHHTWSHPNNLRRLSNTGARSQIERGMKSITAALRKDTSLDHISLAPFFRFPGLNDSPRLTKWLGKKNIAIMSCELGSDDWRGISPNSIYRRTLANVAAAGKGIIIMHDTKVNTARALSQLLTELKRRGYTAAHMQPKSIAPSSTSSVQMIEKPKS